VTPISRSSYLNLQFREFSPEVTELKRLYIKPEFRRKGLARQLSLCLVDYAREMGFKKVFLGKSSPTSHSHSPPFNRHTQEAGGGFGALCWDGVQRNRGCLSLLIFACHFVFFLIGLL